MLTVVKNYDFKRSGTKEGDVNYNNSNFHYRGVILSISQETGIIVTSARDIGNIMVGYVAGNMGLSWKAARLGFDSLESIQNRKFTGESLSTRNAERYGYDVDSQLYKPNSWFKRKPIELPIPDFVK